MRLVMRKRAHQRLLRIHQSIGKEIRAVRKMRFGKTMAAFDVLQGLMIRRSSWEDKGKGKA